VSGGCGYSLGPLTEGEAAELVGVEDVGAIFPLSGGNPFYLQQLARVPAVPPLGGQAARGQVPAAVSASLISELAELSAPTLLFLNAAAVLGDPFEADLAAGVADLEEVAAFRALDDLLARTLVREAEAPRSVAFRHPPVRHAVYEASAGGRRLGAHARAAQALARRGAGAGAAIASPRSVCARRG